MLGFNVRNYISIHNHKWVFIHWTSCDSVCLCGWLFAKSVGEDLCLRVGVCRWICVFVLLVADHGAISCAFVCMSI